ncbi:hypothetical protein M407DRAFT_64848 [Tulasnella calospora MUT 4182]|uniref:RTA1 like protein n=1 Tax=Tulasnella calospora MUT 4182 TaxID=1051891 RepID=A0A0C3QW67_9AGAM|nr:hypothetical protein M407DRAFT_64848 [Tulasnella calospora MUT 4182]
MAGEHLPSYALSSSIHSRLPSARPPDDNNTVDRSNTNFPYDPTLWAAYLFAVLYGIALLWQLGQAIRYKTGYMWVMLVACSLEVLGFGLSIIAIKQMTTLWPIVVSQTGLIVAPAFIAAQDYMIIGRVMSFVGKEYGYINHTKITKIFVGADIFAILTQAGGGSMLAGANGDLNQMKVAQKVLLTGLALQVITFGIFFFVATAFDVRSYRSPALHPFKEQMKGMRKLWTAFYISCALITARSIYRTVEFAEIKFTPGNDNADGYLLNHEWPMYVFDSIPILISIIFFSIWHPGAYLPSKKGLRIDGTYEEQFGRRKFLCCGPRK